MGNIFRQEIKYVIRKEEYLRIKKHLDAIMQKDKHGRSYLVRSQYYDSIGDRDLYDNLFGVMEKRKIRVRIYSTKDKKAKLEYKSKSNTDGLKPSIILTREEAIMMENCDYNFLLWREEDLAKTLYVKLMRGIYRPKTIVDYNRTVYMHPISNTRVTFDTDVKATKSPYGLFKDDLNFIPLLKGNQGILEVKYNDFLIAPIKKIIENIDAMPESCSKYSRARFI